LGATLSCAGIASFPGKHQSVFEHNKTSLSKGELYTILTNKDRHGGKRSLIVVVAGTKSEGVREAM
jgi:hypothetical protein